jgi:hypothetical protein
MEADLQVVEYGFSIITYATRYDKAWIDLVKNLRELLATKCSNQITGSTDFFPDETIRKVMEYMNDSDLRKSALVCSRWNVLSCEDHLWSKLLISRFGVSASSIVVKHSYRKERQLSSKQLHRDMFLSFLNVLRMMEGEKLNRERLFIPAYMYQHTIHA